MPYAVPGVGAGVGCCIFPSAKGRADQVILHTNGTLSLAAPIGCLPRPNNSCTSSLRAATGVASPAARRKEEAELQSMLAEAQYLSEVRPVPARGRARDQVKLWRDRHDTSWDDTKQVSDLVNELSGEPRKRWFFRLVSQRKVYKVSVWDAEQGVAVDQLSSVDPRKKRKGKRQWRRGRPVERVAFHKLPGLPPVPALQLMR